MAAKRDYTAEEIDLGMTYSVMAAGNDRAAARDLKRDHGVTIPRETLRDWRIKSKSDEYAEIRTRLEQKRREEMAEGVIALNMKELEAAHLAADQIITDLKAKKIPAKDVPKALQQLQIAFGIGVDKSNVLLDRPTEIVERRVNLPA